MARFLAHLSILSRVDRQYSGTCREERQNIRGGLIRMSSVRVLVGTRKGAFVLESDGKRSKWNISGPHFGGWELYHVKASPADPNRLYASQSSGWFGQMMQRYNAGRTPW